MTDDRIALRELLEKGRDASFLREMIGFAAQRLTELEVGEVTGAAHGERSPDRLVQRNGYRDRDWQTKRLRCNSCGGRTRSMTGPQRGWRVRSNSSKLGSTGFMLTPLLLPAREQKALLTASRRRVRGALQAALSPGHLRSATIPATASSVRQTAFATMRKLISEAR